MCKNVRSKVKRENEGSFRVKTISWIGRSTFLECNQGSKCTTKKILPKNMEDTKYVPEIFAPIPSWQIR